MTVAYKAVCSDGGIYDRYLKFGHLDTIRNVGTITLDYSLQLMNSVEVMDSVQVYEAAVELHQAIEDNDMAQVFELLDGDPEINTLVTCCEVQEGDGTAVHYAAGLGYTAIMDIVLQYLLDINLQSTYGGLRLSWAALHCAAAAGHVSTTQYLIQHGANLDVQDQMKMTPLHWALDREKIDTAKILVLYGANVDLQEVNKKSALHIAIEKGMTSLAEFMIHRTKDINIKEGHGRSLLHMALWKGNNQLAQSLMKNGADVNAVDRYGQGPLHLSGDFEDITRMLLAKGANVNTVSRDGQAPLHWASYATAQMLLVNGANLDQVDKDGQSPLHMAASWGEPDTVSLLLSYGMSIDLQDRHGQTPFHLAANHKNKAAVRILTMHGADPTMFDHKKRTPIDMAPASWWIELLMEHISSSARNGLPDKSMPSQEYGMRSGDRVPQKLSLVDEHAEEVENRDEKTRTETTSLYNSNSAFASENDSIEDCGASKLGPENDCKDISSPLLESTNEVKFAKSDELASDCGKSGEDWAIADLRSQNSQYRTEFLELKEKFSKLEREVDHLKSMMASVAINNGNGTIKGSNLLSLAPLKQENGDPELVREVPSNGYPSPDGEIIEKGPVSIENFNGRINGSELILNDTSTSQICDIL